jgi:hypothetical protein
MLHDAIFSDIESYYVKSSRREAVSMVHSLLFFHPISFIFHLLRICYVQAE